MSMVRLSTPPRSDRVSPRLVDRKGMAWTDTRRRFGHHAAAVAARLRLAVPRGQTLPPAVWQARHRVLLGSLCLHAVAIRSSV